MSVFANGGVLAVGVAERDRLVGVSPTSSPLTVTSAVRRRPMLDVLVGDGLRRDAGSIRSRFSCRPSCRSSTGPGRPARRRRGPCGTSRTGPRRRGSRSTPPCRGRRRRCAWRVRRSAGRFFGLSLPGAGKSSSAWFRSPWNGAVAQQPAGVARPVPSAARPSCAGRAARRCRRGCRPGRRQRRATAVSGVIVDVTAACSASSACPARPALPADLRAASSPSAFDARRPAARSSARRSLCSAIDAPSASCSLPSVRTASLRTSSGGLRVGGELRHGSTRSTASAAATSCRPVAASSRSSSRSSMAAASSLPPCSAFHFVGRNSFRLSMARAFTSAGGVGLEHVEHRCAGGEVVVGREMSTMRAFCAAVSFGVREQLAEPRQHRLRPQFPHEVRDLVVPFGEVLVEVREDGVAPLRVGPARRCSGRRGRRWSWPS